jgi:hypothetical protein
MSLTGESQQCAHSAKIVFCRFTYCHTEGTMEYETRIGRVRTVKRAAMIAGAIVSLSGVAWAQSSSGGDRGSTSGGNVSGDSAGGGGGELMPRDVCQPDDMNPSCVEMRRNQQRAPSDRGTSSGTTGPIDVQERATPNPETPVTPSDR